MRVRASKDTTILRIIFRTVLICFNKFFEFNFVFNRFISGMGIGNNLFIKHCGDRQLEVEMRNAKKTFPKLQIIFVIISRKGDPAYGQSIDKFYFLC